MPSSLLSEALADAAPLTIERGWQPPSPSTIAAAERLLALVDHVQRRPAVLVDPDGAISFEWEAADHGWLTLKVDAQGQLTHRAVIGEDEFERVEAFGDTLPEWAAELLGRLMRAGH